MSPLTRTLCVPIFSPIIITVVILVLAFVVVVLAIVIDISIIIITAVYKILMESFHY